MSTSKETTHQSVQEKLAAYFERSVATVGQYADVIEHRYARPALEVFAENFRERPIMMTFLAILAALAALPILSFVGISVFVISSITFFAAVATVLACIVAESIIISIGICTLCSLVLVAIIVTTFFFFIYSMLRFILLVRSEGGSGVMEWAFETRQHFLPARPEGHEFDVSATMTDHRSPESKVNARDSDPGDQ
ncbi:hypothetical protein V8B97DRAFT_1943979 [Scleroderma yunnanense]